MAKLSGNLEKVPANKPIDRMDEQFADSAPGASGKLLTNMGATNDINAQLHTSPTKYINPRKLPLNILDNEKKEAIINGDNLKKR